MSEKTMKKNLIVMGGVLVVLLLIAFLVMQKPGEQSVSVTEGAKLAQIDSVNVDKIRIAVSGRQLMLEKRGAEWFIAQPIMYKADQQAVAQAIQQLKAFEVKSVVSSKPEKHPVFQVDTAGLAITVSERGTETLSFILGKQGTNWSESYARKNGSNDVVLVDGGQRSLLDKQLKEWRDKNIATVPREQIKEVKFQFGDTTFAVQFSDSTWKIGAQQTNMAEVNTLLGALASVQADDFADSTLTPAPKISAMISYAGLQLQFAAIKGTTKYFVLSSNTPQAFVMESWRVNQLLKRKKELLPK